MKIYFASTEPHNMKMVKLILLSFYDIYISSIPFRKETFKILKNEQKQITRSPDNSQAGTS